jgi:hypothetical protein
MGEDHKNILKLTKKQRAQLAKVRASLTLTKEQRERFAEQRAQLEKAKASLALIKEQRQGWFPSAEELQHARRRLDTDSEAATLKRIEKILARHQRQVSEQQEPAVRQSSSAWIRDTLKTMEDNKRIPDGVTLVALSENLAERMQMAKKRGEVSVALKTRTIMNLLRARKYWPRGNLQKHDAGITSA